jgi:3-succinoylsemialdehyde-pyridine dehydrogenase
MRNYKKFYINGQWVTPQNLPTMDVINPATEEVAGTITLGSSASVDQAVSAAKQAFDEWSQSTKEHRLALLRRIATAYESRIDDMAAAISEEMGAPLETLAKPMQATLGLWHFQTMVNVLENYSFEQTLGTTTTLREPAGVCALITPWNWPINQIACKVAPALAAGCTMVLKPSEVAPFSAHVLAEILDEAGVPKGVFNLVDGDGAGVGSALSAHPDIDMISFTGSTRAGKLISKSAADTIKRVALELGGKSANIILEDADFEQAITHGVQSMMHNTGQTCSAPSRMLVPESRLKDVETIAAAAAQQIVVGDPAQASTMVGPVVSQVQFDKIQGLIEKGIEEGAKVIAGGPGRPEGLSKGYYVRPTIFSAVNNDMTIAREEIFGPVLCVIPYQNEEEAIRIANDTCYGLSGYVTSSDLDHSRRVAKKLRTGNVHLNGASIDMVAPFGGYKQSGIGREWGQHGLDEFLEVKAMMGYSPG